MSVVSLEFFVFFLLVAIVYYILPGRFQWIWLLLASLYFYIDNSAWYQALFFFIYVLVNYLLSLGMGEDHPRGKKFYLTALIFDITLLAVFKYAAFFYDILIEVFNVLHIDIETEMCRYIISLLKELAPGRISYFALIVIGYISDVYWGKVKVQKNPGKMLLFTSYFPQMTSGPIVQYEDMEGSLFGEKHRFSYERFIFGIERVLWGVFKKLVISERCAVIVNTIYGDYNTYNGLYVPVAAVFFVLQLYTDFSGLMDIVLGFSQSLQIDLPENFDTPFYSENLSEFWRRWHITLGAFLRDYVLFPVQNSKFFKNMRKKFRKKFGKDYEKKFNLPLYLSLLISWFLIGLWHGGGWNYIFGSGLYMWFMIVLGDLTSPFFVSLADRLHINTGCFSFRLFKRARTAIAFMFGLSFFRAETLRDGFDMWKGAFSGFNPWIFFDRSMYELGLEKGELEICFIGIAMLFIVSLLQQRGSVREMLARQNYLFRLGVFVVLFVLTFTWGYYGTGFNAADFIYGRF